MKPFARLRIMACFAAVVALLSFCGQAAEPDGHTRDVGGSDLHHRTWLDYVGPEILWSLNDVNRPRWLSMC